MYFFQGQLHTAQTLEIEVNHPALIHGASVFTTLRVDQHLDARNTRWPAHCDRLAHSMQVLGWGKPNWHRIRTGAIAIAKVFPVLRITLFPDGTELITGRSLPPDLPQRQQQGIRAWLAEPTAALGTFSRSLPSYKTGNYLAPWLAMQQASSHQAQEAILINDQGDWLETSTGNLWGWRSGRWYTPPLSAGILPGVSRQALLSHLQALSIEIAECDWTPAIATQFEALIYTNSVVQVVPITQVCGQSLTVHYNPQHPAIEEIRSFFLKTDAE